MKELLCLAILIASRVLARCTNDTIVKAPEVQAPVENKPKSYNQEVTYPAECFNCIDDCTKEEVVTCPAERPFCATRVVSPEFHNQLICHEAISSTCLYEYTPQQSQLVCTCQGNKCNRPFLAMAIHRLSKYSKRRIESKQRHRLADHFLETYFHINTTHPFLVEFLTGQRFDLDKLTTKVMREDRASPTKIMNTCTDETTTRNVAQDMA